MREAKKSNTWKHTELGPLTDQAAASQWNYGLTFHCYTLLLPVNAMSVPEEKGPFAFSWPVVCPWTLTSSVSRAGPLLLNSNKCLLEADFFYHF